VGLGGEGATLAERVSTDRAAIAARSLRRSPTRGDPDVLEVVRRQLRQHVRIDLVVPEIRLVLAETEAS